MVLKNDRILSLLGLAKKAGKAVSGEFCVENAIKSAQAHVVIIAEDASVNTTKKFRNMTDYRGISCMVYADKDRLGNAVGCEQRAVAAVTDPGFAQSIVKKYKQMYDTEQNFD